MRATSKSKSGESENSADELSSKLGKLFEDSLKDIYWAEKALTKAIPKMIKNASSQELVEALENHLSETEEHVRRVEEVFQSIGKEPKSKKCDAMEGLIKEADLSELSISSALLDAKVSSAMVGELNISLTAKCIPLERALETI